MILAVRDLDDAVAVYRDRLGIPTRLQGADTTHGVRVAACSPPSGGTIELTSPIDQGGSSQRGLAAFVRERGEGMYALVLESPDLEATAKVLRARGIDLRRSAADSTRWEIDPAAVHGARIRIEPRSVVA